MRCLILRVELKRQYKQDAIDGSIAILKTSRLKQKWGLIMVFTSKKSVKSTKKF